MKAFLLTAALVLAATGVSPAATKTVSYRTLAKGDGSSSSITERRGLVIRSSKTYAKYWDALHSGQTPKPRYPKVDFARNMVVLVTQGQQSSGGHEVTIRRIRDSGERMTLSVTEVSPGPNCITTQQITSPFHLVRMRKSKDRARFTREDFVSPCG